MSSSSSSNESFVQDGLTCPISHEIFKDPVIAEDGITYERAYIKEAFKRGHLSPLTREKIGTSLIDDTEMKQRVKEKLSEKLNKRYYKDGKLTPKKAAERIEGTMRRRISRKRPINEKYATRINRTIKRYIDKRSKASSRINKTAKNFLKNQTKRRTVLQALIDYNNGSKYYEDVRAIIMNASQQEVNYNARSLGTPLHFIVTHCNHAQLLKITKYAGIHPPSDLDLENEALLKTKSLISLLLKKHANINAIRNDSNEPFSVLYDAISAGHANTPKIVKFLIKQGAEIDEMTREEMKFGINDNDPENNAFWFDKDNEMHLEIYNLLLEAL